MKFAVLSQNQEFVDNVIIAREDQKEEMEAALGRTLMDAAPLGLTVGDFYNGAAWTRNIDGEQVVLPVGVSADVAEALAILNGEEEGNADAE
nr:MAG TPA: hypothetical protein [Caudoviricetes sp.]